MVVQPDEIVLVVDWWVEGFVLGASGFGFRVLHIHHAVTVSCWVADS